METNVRFFVIDYDADPVELRECDEFEFLESSYPISYERHTVRENGVNQICLIKMPRG